MEFFITFEGIEGCGKTTQISRLANHLRQQGVEVVETREPGGCAIADKIRAILLDAENSAMVPETELLLYAAARAQHIAEVVKPALSAGKTVLCDRFCDATVAYQGYGRALDIATIEQLNHYACQGVTPHLTLLLDLPVEIGLGRARQRNADSSAIGANGSQINEDRFEQESLEFHQRIRHAYLQLADQYPQRITTIDASGDSSAVAQRIIDATQPLVNHR